MVDSYAEPEPTGHQPQGRANRWGRKQIAYLIDEIVEPTFIRISTKLPLIEDEVEVRRYDNRLHRPGSGSKSAYINWQLNEERENHPLLREVTGNIIHLASIPTLGSVHGDRKIKPYSDILFKDGELQVNVIGTGNVATRSFNLGNIVGLTIVTAGVDYPVW
ncbi:MAG TPA: hypothetical protein VLF90_00095 [Patescibacteria group bacterium]|nr:hypothetical protein [Patescibacteria group bacterium]